MKTLALLLLVLTGCATPSFENYAASMRTWKGASVDKLVAAWGVPNRTYKTPDGNTSLEYMQTGASMYMPVGYGVTQAQFWCKTTFIADKNNIVQHANWEGNACKSD